MNLSFEDVKRNLLSQSFVNDITCFIVFGSSVVNHNMGIVPDDVDVCVVVNNRNADLSKISEFIFSSFSKPDFRIYFEDEIDSNLQFMDKGVGFFAMEYFANGVSLCGNNIFINKVKTIPKRKLKESYLNKIFEYIIRIREAYVSKNSNEEYKMWHTYKYVIRLSIDILLYESRIKYSNLSTLSKEDIINLCKKYKIVKESIEINFNDLEKNYKLYQEINLYVVNYHTKGIKNKLKKFFRF